MTRHDIDEQEIRAALRRLRDGDERSTPPFQQILAAHAVERASVARAFMGRASIAIAAVVVAVGVYLITSRPRLTVPEEVIALSAWRPASDVLLDVPGRRLLTHAPLLGASLIDLKLGGIPR